MTTRAIPKTDKAIKAISSKLMSRGMPKGVKKAQNGPIARTFSILLSLSVQIPVLEIFKEITSDENC